MITEEQMQIVDELSDVLEGHNLDIDIALTVLIYLVADTLKQATDEIADKEVAMDTAKEMVGLYMLMCRIGANSDTITVQ